MSRMRWDRIRGWDRMWGGLSNEEVEEAREAAWLERELERERERTERQRSREESGRPHRPRRGNRAQFGGTGGSGRPRRSISGGRRPALPARSVAVELGVGLRRLEAARENHQRTLKELGSQRSDRATAAAHLGVTTAELDLLRQVLAGYVPETKSRVAALVEKVAAQRSGPSELRPETTRIRSVRGIEPVAIRAPMQVGPDAEKRLRAQARRLGVEVETFHAARLVENRVSEMTGRGPGRSENIAKRLGVDVAELKDLRRAFAGDSVASVVRTRAVARRVAALGEVEPSPPRR